MDIRMLVLCPLRYVSYREFFFPFFSFFFILKKINPVLSSLFRQSGLRRGKLFGRIERNKPYFYHIFSERLLNNVSHVVPKRNHRRKGRGGAKLSRRDGSSAKANLHNLLKCVWVVVMLSTNIYVCKEAALGHCSLSPFFV
jgi:hypothetical protein